MKGSGVDCGIDRGYRREWFCFFASKTSPHHDLYSFTALYIFRNRLPYSPLLPCAQPSKSQFSYTE